MSTRITRSQIQNHPNQFQIESRSLNECGVFNIVEVPKDGDCLFSSVLDFMEKNRNHFENAPQSANLIRLEAVNYMLSKNANGFQHNFERFFGNIKYNLETRIENLAKYGQNEQQNEAIRQAYRRYMSKPFVFGTFSELIALAERYGFIVYIFQKDTSNNYICYEAGTTGKTAIDRKKLKLFLLFTGSTDAGHFRPLYPSIAPSVIQAGYYQLIDSLSTTHGTKIIVSKSQNLTVDELDPQNLSTETTPISQKTSEIGLSEPEAPVISIDSAATIDPEEIITNENPKPSLICDVCKQSFPSKRGLTVHRSRHAKEANDTTAAHIKERLNKTSLSNPSSTQNTDATKSRSALDSECDKFRKSFECFENSEAINETEFDETVEKFQNFLFTARQRLPGPQHPSIKFYRLRQQKKNRKETSSQQSRSSNPQRTDARAKQRRRDKFQYDLAQYWYYNQRKKAVRLVMTKGGSKQCQIKMDLMEKHIKSVFENPNNNTLESYPTTEAHQNIVLSEEDIRIQIKRMPLDTSAGPDRVLVKTLRQLNVAKSISSIANTMLRTSYVPKGFRNGIMIFIDKEGDVNCVNNWRPLIILGIRQIWRQNF